MWWPLGGVTTKRSLEGRCLLGNPSGLLDHLTSLIEKRITQGGLVIRLICRYCIWIDFLCFVFYFVKWSILVGRVSLALV